MPTPRAWARVGRLAVPAAPERLEDGAGELGRHPGPGVLDDQLQVGPLASALTHTRVPGGCAGWC